MKYSIASSRDEVVAPDLVGERRGRAARRRRGWGRSRRSPRTAAAARRARSARVEPAPERVRGARDDREPAVGAQQPRGRAVDQHPAAAGLDPARELGEQGLEAARGPDEALLARLAVAEAAALADLVPDPAHRDLLGALAELAPHQRPPDVLPGGLAHVARGSRSSPSGARTRRSRGGRAAAAAARAPSAAGSTGRERAEAEQVADAVEGPDPALDRERRAGRVAAQQPAEAELLEGFDRDRVAGEQVVVVALDPQPVADLHRRRLAAEPGPALVDVAVDPRLDQPAGAGQPRGAGADHRDRHQSTSRRWRSEPRSEVQAAARSAAT